MKFFKQKGVASIIILAVMGILAVSLPVATKLVQDNQDNRSSATGGVCIEGSKTCISKYIRKRCTKGVWVQEDCRTDFNTKNMVCIAGGWCKRESVSPTGTPSSKITLTPTLTPTPSLSLISTTTPTSTPAKVTPTKTPAPTKTPMPTKTPAPTKTPMPTPTLDQTGYAQPILPPVGAELIFNESSNTLKASIENVNDGEYYVTRMWIKDPYNQFKKAVNSSQWRTSSVLKFVYNRMNSEVTTKNLKDKIVVAINGSAFWGDRDATSGYYSLNKPRSSSMNNIYKKSPDGTLIINDGEIARNRPQDFGWLGESIFGINKIGNLKNYPISGNTLVKRQEQHQAIINDGVKNTFAFNIALVLNGKSRLSDGSCDWCKDERARQIWCQIDRNNFMFITYIKEGGKNLIEVAQLAKDLGCKTAVNLDGGGSTQIAYKKSGQSTFNYKRSTRPVVDALYVTE